MRKMVEGVELNESVDAVAQEEKEPDGIDLSAIPESESGGSSQPRS